MTRPGTSVPLVVMRGGEEVTLDVTIEELDLDAEAGGQAQNEPDSLSEGFGITLQNLTPQIANRLRLPSGTEGAVVVDVENGGPGEAGGIQAGDVILSVNRVPVTTATDAVRELNGVESGRTAFLLIQRGQTQVFLQVLKE